MASSDAHGDHAPNACVSCSQRKRKCDRVRPSCSTCAKAGRFCIYGGDPVSDRPTRIQFTSSTTSAESSAAHPASLFISSILPQAQDQVNPGGTYQRQDINNAVRTHVLGILGSTEDIRSIATTYFETIAKRIPIISNQRFLGRLAEFSPGNSSSADYAALCLSMRLLLDHPPENAHSMQSPLYLTVKNVLTLLETTSHLSLELLQCRLLVAVYEIGHGISPAASISVAVAAKSARALGLHRQWAQPTINEHAIESEERKRVWWAIFNLDRYINLCEQDAIFGTESPGTEVLLPFDDTSWAENHVPPFVLQTLGTSSDITMGQFARECQVSYLTGRVLRHIFDPVSDPQFHANEALQLERTLKAFMPLLMEEDSKYGQYCAALAICTSALFSLYDAALNQYPDDEVGRMRVADSLETASIRLTDFSRHLFSDPEAKDIRFMSPLIPHSLFQAAVIQHRAWKRNNEIFCKQRADSLVKILGHFKKRWLVAGKYIDSLHTLFAD